MVMFETLFCTVTPVCFLCFVFIAVLIICAQSILIDFVLQWDSLKDWKYFFFSVKSLVIMSSDLRLKYTKKLIN